MEYWNQFYRLPVLTENPTADDIRRMTNVTYETIRQLKAIKLPIEHWDMVFIFGLHERLNSETKKQWEMHRSSETPKLIEMLEFLDKQAGALEVSKMTAAGAAGTSKHWKEQRQFKTCNHN